MHPNRTQLLCVVIASTETTFFLPAPASERRPGPTRGTRRRTRRGPSTESTFISPLGAAERAAAAADARPWRKRCGPYDPHHLLPPVAGERRPAPPLPTHPPAPTSYIAPPPPGFTAPPTPGYHRAAAPTDPGGAHLADPRRRPKLPCITRGSPTSWVIEGPLRPPARPPARRRATTATGPRLATSVPSPANHRSSSPSVHPPPRPRRALLADTTRRARAKNAVVQSSLKTEFIPSSKQSSLLYVILAPWYSAAEVLYRSRSKSSSHFFYRRSSKLGLQIIYILEVHLFVEKRIKFIEHKKGSHFVVKQSSLGVI